MRMKTRTRGGDDGRRSRRGGGLLLLLTSLSVLGSCSASGGGEHARPAGGNDADPADEGGGAGASRRTAEGGYREDPAGGYRPVHTKTSEGSSHAHSFAGSPGVVSSSGDESEPGTMMMQLRHTKSSEADCARQYTPRSYKANERVSNYGRNYHCKPFPFTGEFLFLRKSLPLQICN